MSPTIKFRSEKKEGGDIIFLSYQPITHIIDEKNYESGSRNY
jgi:hypothetical protein